MVNVYLKTEVVYVLVFVFLLDEKDEMVRSYIFILCIQHFVNINPNMD